MEEASDGAADDLLEICASVGFDEVEVREAIEHLVVANQITHLGEGSTALQINETGGSPSTVIYHEARM